MDTDSDNEKFVALIEDYKVIFDKSQNSAAKEAKQIAINEVINKWTATSGKTLTQKSFLKKLSNLKVRSKAAAGKKLALCRWQSQLLDLTKDDDRELLPVATGSGATPNRVNVNMAKPEDIDLTAEDIVNKYETSETKHLSINQLRRVILLEQLKCIQLKRMRMERLRKTEAASSSSNNIEIEYIGFNGMDNGDAEPNNF